MTSQVKREVCSGLQPVCDHGLVSVITPAFRAHQTLARAVRSMISQTYSHWEMLIVSDDHSDYRQLLVNEGIVDSRLRFFSTEAYASGPSRPRNLALGEARGDYIALLDADDLYYHERLATLLPLAAKSGMCGDNVLVVIESTDRPIGTPLLQSEALHQLDLQAYSHTTTPMSFMFRRELVQWDWEVDLPLGADTLFNLRGIEQVGWVPVVGTVLHECRVRQGALAEPRADQAYDTLLERLNANGLGFETSHARDTVRDMLIRRQAEQQCRAGGVKTGLYRNVQQFFLAGDDPRDSGLLPCPAFAG